jgi:adenylosuccinate lyase
MPTSAIDSAVFRNIFGTEAMRRVWSDENRTQRYLDIEAALARAQANLGVIPAEAAAEITKQAKVEYIDFEKLRQQTERIGYPVLGVVQQLVQLCRENLPRGIAYAPTRLDVVEFGGACGTLASLGKDGLESKPLLPESSAWYRRRLPGARSATESRKQDVFSGC